MKKFLSLIAVVLVLATCLSLSVSAALSGSKITIASAKSDTAYNNTDKTSGVNKAAAECAVENLRPAGGLWANVSTTYQAASDSIAQNGERYITLGLSETADISGLRIQWYQGGSSVTDITDEKQRTYMFLIQASAEAEGDDNFTDIYGSYAKGEYKSSGTGKDFEEYACTFSGAKRIRIWSVGNDGGANSEGAYNVAIRNIEVYGTGKGGTGADVGKTDTPAASTDTGTGTGTGTPSSSSPVTGDFENLVIFGTVAVLSCAAVVIIRKKIRER